MRSLTHCLDLFLPPKNKGFLKAGLLAYASFYFCTLPSLTSGSLQVHPHLQ